MIIKIMIDALYTIQLWISMNPRLKMVSPIYFSARLKPNPWITSEPDEIRLKMNSFHINMSGPPVMRWCLKLQKLLSRKFEMMATSALNTFDITLGSLNR